MALRFPSSTTHPPRRPSPNSPANGSRANRCRTSLTNHSRIMCNNVAADNAMLSTKVIPGALSGSLV